MSYSMGYDEGYKCFSCDAKITSDIAISSGWKCPNCGDYIWIAAPQLGGGHVKNRKRACEINRLDSVNMAGTEEIYQVLGTTKLKNGKISIGLKNYGSLKVDEDDFLDVIMGAYYDSSWSK